MEDRGTGETFRTEDDALVYHTEELITLTKGKYRGCGYSVETDGIHPKVALSIFYDKKSGFDGFNIVILKDESDRYELERYDIGGRGHVIYIYTFNNRPDDKEKRYTIKEMVEYAKKFIDIIKKSEENLSGVSIEFKTRTMRPVSPSTGRPTSVF